MKDVFGKPTQHKDYPFRTWKCPACKKPQGAIRQHITIWAKREPFEFMLGNIKRTPHFDIYKKHTAVARTPALTQRVWLR